MNAGFFVVLGSVAQCVDDRDTGVNFDGAAVEDSGTVAPFADRG